MSWKVRITKKAARRAKNLPKQVLAAFQLLWRDLEANGPVQPAWPSFGKLKGSKNEWHCHLKKGKSTYVACWKSKRYVRHDGKEEDEKGEIEIYYVWTHEKAPYK